MSIRILVVDDDRKWLESYTKVLSRKLNKHQLGSGDGQPQPPQPLVEVEGADTYGLALQRMQTQPFEILVVDLRMPGPGGDDYGGLQLITASKEIDPLRLIIVVTGFGTVELARRTYTQGIFDFIEKSHKMDKLVEPVRKAIASLEEKFFRSGNPFTLTTGESPTVFGGRRGELKFFEARLNRVLHSRFREHFLVLGNWGIGKSTLFREYKKMCQNQGFLASIVHLEPLSTGSTTLDAARSIVQGILRDMPYPVSRFKKLMAYFDSIGFSIPAVMSIELSRDIPKPALSPQTFLYNALLKMWEDVSDKSAVMVVLLDDLDNFLTVPDIVMTLRSTLMSDELKQARILLGIACRRDSWLELTSIEKHHPVSRFFTFRAELAPLTESEVRETVLKSIEERVTFAEEVLNKVFTYTEGHPFEMQVLCYHLFNNHLSRRVEPDVWEKALEETLRDIGFAIFDHWLQKASPGEAKVLQIIAGSEDPMTTKQIREQARRSMASVKPSNVAKYLQRLTEKRLINKSGRGLYEISDKMFKVYVDTRSA